MGVDVVALVMEIEEKFGVVIPDRDAERITTLGDLHQYLLRQRDLGGDSVCLSSALFYRARRALCEQFGYPRRSVAPCTPLDDLVPRQGRRGHWRRLREALAPFPIPDLQRPAWLWITFGVAWLSLMLGALAGGLASCLLRDPLHLVALFLLAANVVCILAWYATRPLAVCLPGGTMAGLVHRTIGPNRDRGQRALRCMNDRQVWDQMCQVIAQNLGVDVARLKPESSFTDDLGL
jgi:acyl carrier protein